MVDVAVDPEVSADLAIGMLVTTYSIADIILELSLVNLPVLP
jgi:hypothetical protein